MSPTLLAPSSPAPDGRHLKVQSTKEEYCASHSEISVPPRQPRPEGLQLFPRQLPDSESSGYGIAAREARIEVTYDNFIPSGPVI